VNIKEREREVLNQQQIRHNMDFEDAPPMFSSGGDLTVGVSGYLYVFFLLFGVGVGQCV